MVCRHNLKSIVRGRRENVQNIVRDYLEKFHISKVLTKRIKIVATDAMTRFKKCARQVEKVVTHVHRVGGVFAEAPYFVWQNADFTLQSDSILSNTTCALNHIPPVTVDVSVKRGS